MTLTPILIPIRNLINSENINRLEKIILDENAEIVNNESINNILNQYDKILEAISIHSHIPLDRQIILEQIRRIILNLNRKTSSLSSKHIPGFIKNSQIEAFFQKNLSSHPEMLTTLLLWMFLRFFGGISTDQNLTEFSRSLIDEWNLGAITESVFINSGLNAFNANKELKAIKFLVSQQYWLENFRESTTSAIFESWFNDDQIRSYLGVNRYQNVLWFNKEAFESLIRYMHAIAWLSSISNPTKDSSKHIEDMVRMQIIIMDMVNAGKRSECQVAKLLEKIKQ